MPIVKTLMNDFRNFSKLIGPENLAKLGIGLGLLGVAYKLSGPVKGLLGIGKGVAGSVLGRESAVMNVEAGVVNVYSKGGIPGVPSPTPTPGAEPETAPIGMLGSFGVGISGAASAAALIGLGVLQSSRNPLIKFTGFLGNIGPAMLLPGVGQLGYANAAVSAINPLGVFGGHGNNLDLDAAGNWLFGSSGTPYSVRATQRCMAHLVTSCNARSCI